MKTFTRNTQILLLAATALTLAANRAPGASTENTPTGSVHVEGYICVSNETSCTGTEIPLSGTDILIKGVVPQLFFDNTTNTVNDDTEWYLRTDSNRFRLIDFGASGSRANEVFSIEALAPPSALRVRSNGFVGMGTSVPARDLHIRADVLPAIRIQDASQAWEIEADAVSFAVYDQTNNKRMLQIKPDAPSNSFVIAADGNVGLGKSAPTEELHIRRASGAGSVRILTESSDDGSVQWLMKTNSTNRRFVAQDAAGNNQSQILFENGGTIKFLGASAAVPLMTVSPSGLSLPAAAYCGSNGDVPGPGGCDAVFTPGYQIESIEEHAASMWGNSHLPAVGPTTDGKTIEFNVHQRYFSMLNELEMAHIYIERLNEENKRQRTALAELESRVAGMAAMEKRLARMEGLLAAQPTAD